MINHIFRALRYLYNEVWNILYVPYKVKEIRRKDKIEVLFVISDLASWKTERLFNTMKDHDRFNPIIGIEKNMEVSGGEVEVENYCRHNNYPYLILAPQKTLISQTCADLILYQKPYRSLYPSKHRISWNRRALSIFVLYAFHSINELWQFRQEIMLNSWQYFFENDLSIGTAKNMMRNSGKNIIVTGVPFMDDLVGGSTILHDPWKYSDGRKRIIYAPHCTVGDMHLKGAQYSTFLEFSEYILDIAEKYKDQVCFAFKPHPKLYGNLLKIWGKVKTDAYYEKWHLLENGQLELGKYLDLFFHSDAMIHDCGSFTIEYLYTKCPVMYLVRDEHHADNMNDFGRKAFDMHYKGKNQDDIESFIINVINERDDMKAERLYFYRNYLLPPHHKPSCTNIINSILGIEEYR